MVIMRWLIVILAIALAVCLFLLLDRREKRRERRGREVRISSIYKKMYESPWVREMVAAVEAAGGAFTTATVRPDAVIIPDVYHYALDSATTRLFDPYEVFVVAYIIYACLDGDRFAPPAPNKDGTMTILPLLEEPAKKEPY